jgi:hypothetical protein
MCQSGQKLTRSEREANGLKQMFENSQKKSEILKSIFRRQTKSAFAAHPTQNTSSYGSNIRRSTSAESFRSNSFNNSSGFLNSFKDDSKEKVTLNNKKALKRYNSNESLSSKGSTQHQYYTSPASILKQSKKQSVNKNNRSNSRNVKFDRHDNHYQYRDDDNENENESTVYYDSQLASATNGRPNDVVYVFHCSYSISRNKRLQQTFDLSSIVPLKPS